MSDIDTSDSEGPYASQFINKFYKNIPKEDNVVVSPLSAEMVLAMVYQGAAGQTAENIASVLNVANQKTAADKYKMLLEKLNSLPNVTLDVANKIYIMKGFPLKDAFKDVIEESFMSRAENINFSNSQKAANEINKWVENKTHDKIKDLISADMLHQQSRLVLINAVYFKGSWEIPFKEEDTKTEAFFKSEDETVDCEMMFVSDEFCYCSHNEKLDASLIVLPYKGDNVCMIIILPNDYDGISQLESDLINMDLNDVMKGENIHYGDVDLSLPKFKIELTTDMKPLFEKMGLEEIFEPDTADFSALSTKSDGLYVSEFIQKAFIEVNEKGTEAAASSAGGLCFFSGPTAFVVDHPFVFVLQARGENGNTVLFTGKVLDPSQ